MFQFYASEAPKEDAAIERYRARHRRLCRGQTPDAASSPQVEALDVEDGRTRKISAKWRQQQPPRVPVSNQLDAEMHLNAFDFSASPEAFEAGEQETAESRAPSGQENQDEVTSLWTRRFQDGPQSGPAKQLPTLGQDALWGRPVHYATQDAQRRAGYYQPQYYA